MTIGARPHSTADDKVLPHRRDPRDRKTGLVTMIENIHDLDWQPVDLAQELLRFVGIDHYVIAGGFFRDILHGVPWKDVDVFISGDLPKPPEGAREYDHIGDALCLEFAGIPINLIRFKHALDVAVVLKRMDIGLCQIGMGTDGKLVSTEAYIRDHARRELTVMFDPQTDFCHDHIKRIQEKYPDHKLVPFEAVICDQDIARRKAGRSMSKRTTQRASQRAR